MSHQILILLFTNPKIILKWKPVKRFIQNQIDKMPKGLLQTSENSMTRIYGEVINNKEQEWLYPVHANGYELTALTAIHC